MFAARGREEVGKCKGGYCEGREQFLDAPAAMLEVGVCLGGGGGCWEEEKGGEG
jgi:hypothetical protein